MQPIHYTPSRAGALIRFNAPVSRVATLPIVVGARRVGSAQPLEHGSDDCALRLTFLREFRKLLVAARLCPGDFNWRGFALCIDVSDNPTATAALLASGLFRGLMEFAPRGYARRLEALQSARDTLRV